MISKTSLVRCPWCEKENTVEKWNDGTFAQCTNREMKRDFMPMTNEKAFKKNSVSFYVCPNCGKWTRGSQLLLIRGQNNSNNELSAEPLIKIK